MRRGDTPVFSLIAGANGARKSTVISGNPETFSPFPLWGPDQVTWPLSPAAATSPIAAGREVLRLADLGANFPQVAVKH